MEKIYDLEGKNKAIVLFKFFAALLITYSHMALLFPKYGGLVTGGAVGDGLFFFCSGFTLFLGRDGGFMNWYKRRVSRIYPSIIMWALLSAVAFGWTWYITDLITTPKYWFIPCIMVYYAIFYLIRRFLMNYMKAVFYGSFALITILSIFILDMNHSVMYAQISFMRIYYFMFMLMGAIVALDLKRNNDEQILGALKRFALRGGENLSGELRVKDEELSPVKSFLLFFFSIVVYYACMAGYKLGPVYCHFQMVSLIPLLSGIYYFFIFCSCQKVTEAFRKPLWGNIVYAISALTLEIYLVQYALFTDIMNFMFPFNLPVMYLMIFALAYVLKCLSQIFTQFFGGGEFEIKKIFKL